MEPSDIDTVPPPAVKNLRSKFEQLALGPAPNGPSLAPGITPRPRATSGTHSISDRVPESPTLRTSNSSSDLRLSRKPPPPPPARSAKPSPVPSPTSSPLLRPITSFPAASNGSLGPRSSLASIVVVPPEVEVEETQSIPSVSSLRSRFA